MKVRELIEQLQACDPEAVVILPETDIGGGYEFAGDLSQSVFDPLVTTRGSILGGWRTHITPMLGEGDTPCVVIQ